jgi:predicted transcriptional regulator
LAAGALFTVIEHVSDHDHYCLSDEQIEGVHQAMAQADRGEFATDRELKEIFGRLP